MAARLGARHDGPLETVGLLVRQAFRKGNDMAAYESDTDFEWKYQTGDVVTFSTVQSDLTHLNGSVATVCGRLDSSEADLNETGPMYRIAIDEQALDAFEDELNPIDNN